MPEEKHDTHYVELGTENVNKWGRGSAYAMCGSRMSLPEDRPKKGEVPTCADCCRIANAECPF